MEFQPEVMTGTVLVAEKMEVKKCEREIQEIPGTLSNCLNVRSCPGGGVKDGLKMSRLKSGFEAKSFEVLRCSDYVKNHVSILQRHFHLENGRYFLLMRKLLSGPRLLFCQKLEIL